MYAENVATDIVCVWVNLFVDSLILLDFCYVYTRQHLSLSRALDTILD